MTKNVNKETGGAISKVSEKSGEKIQKRTKSKSLVIFWVVAGFVVLFLLFFILTAGFSFWFLLTLVLWGWLTMNLKKTLAIGTFTWGKFIVLFSIIFVFTFILIVFTGDKNGNGVKNTEPLPDLEMAVVKYPEAINCDDEVSNIEVTAKNVGEKDLTFAEVSTGKYDFKICDGSTTGSKSSCFPLAGGYLSVNNFGIIKIGETKQIVFTTPAKYDNAITSFSKAKINGEYKYYIDFSQIKNPKLQPTLSKSDLFSVKTNIMNPANEYIKVNCRKN